jgi:AAA+ ATPase superfamily predicted ATPase
VTNDSSLSHALTTLADNKRVVHAALPYAAPPGRKSKRYSVADPYLRFWLRFVGPNIRRSIAVVPISGPRIEEAWTSYRGKAIEPVIQQGLERLLPDPQFGNPRYVGGYWTRNNDVEVDLVGAEAAAPEKVAFVGSIKCGRRNPVRIGGLCRRYIALLR